MYKPQIIRNVVLLNPGRPGTLLLVDDLTAIQSIRWRFGQVIKSATPEMNHKKDGFQVAEGE